MAAEAPLPYDKDGGEYHRGDMIIEEQRSTFNVFMALTKWGSVAVAAVLIWATLAFAVGTGVLTAFLVAAVFTAACIFFLRKADTDVENPAAKH